MRREERVHEGLEVGPPPLREGVADLPFVVDTFPAKLGSDRSKTLVQPGYEAGDFVVFRLEVVAWSV